MSEPIGLRERKAAATRAALSNAVFKRLEQRSLGEITVEECAADANVSRMTFFNYFPTKERALDFELSRWSYELSASVTRRNVSGLRAILEIFEGMGERVATHPHATLRLQAYSAMRDWATALPTLSRADMELVAPGDAPQGMSAGADLMAAIEDAKKRGELSFEGTSYELAHYLGALLHGAATIGHSSPDTDFRALYRRHIRRALGVEFGKHDGLPAVPTPRTPARYRKVKTNGTRK